ncbi:MAG: rhomboid family intramembrane serine protease [Bacteroidales bacterium]|nr:rhomboid family intramembrane serine protease [Bacteroidales bacterium]
MLTYIIIALTSIVSYSAFQNRKLVDQYIFYPPAIRQGEWWRFATYGVLHADWSHLIFNMFSLYLFGKAVEGVFAQTFGFVVGGLLYVLLYIFGLVVSIIPTWLKEKDNDNYSGLGASGAVSGIVFAYIIIYPMSYLGLMFIPVFLPAFIFGGLFVTVSVYLDKKQYGNVNHSAHIIGGIWGIFYLAIIFGLFGDINLYAHFAQNISIVSWSDLVKFGY